MPSLDVFIEWKKAILIKSTILIFKISIKKYVMVDQKLNK